VEIIVVLSQFQKPQSFFIKSLVRQRSFILQSEYLTIKNRFPKPIDGKVAPDISAGQRQMHANHGKSPPHPPLLLPQPSRDRDVAPREARRRALKFVVAGHSRPKDGVACARLCPAIHDLLHRSIKKDVDARDV
jgi:hypothetical protein